ncbi:MAG TPA: MBL fold metallo-hydrolase [Dehalococcoidia bacterium]|nr:MBL fold metallo-hydrolase [Dehalococcoidia bacterium]
MGERYHHRMHSSLLIEADDRMLMIDAGEGHEGTVASVEPDAILITHAHPDHLSRALESLEPGIPVYMSEETTEVVKLPNAQVFTRDKPFEVAGFKVMPQSVVHSLVAPAVCFRISRGNFTLVYSPDVLSIPAREQFLKGVDLYIGDGSSLTRDIIRRRDDKLFGHASMMRQVRWAEGIKQVLFTHVGHLRKTEADVNQALRIASDGRAKLAEDGMSLEFESLQVTTETIAPVLAPVVPAQVEPQNLIEKAEDYDASAPRDDQLRDDWRIVCGWYSTLKEGGNIRFSEETIVQVASKILKELLRRKRKSPSVFTPRPGQMKEHPRELYERITKEWKPEDKAFLETEPGNLEVTIEDFSEIEELVRQPFGSPGGKLWIAPRIVSMIPQHRVYVEPFAGAAAVFWTKEPSEVEVLGDIDPEVMFAYHFIQKASPEDIARLRRYDWRHRRELFEQLKREQPKDDVERFRRFLYLRKASYGSRGVNFMEAKRERAISLDSFERWRERLKGVHLHTGSYEELLDRYDSQDAFFYLDPPYPGHWQGEEHGFTREQWDGLIERLKRLKGKFILSLFRDLAGTLPSHWHVRRIKTHRSMGQDDVGKVLYHYEYLTANFPFKDTAKHNVEELEAREIASLWVSGLFGSYGGKTRISRRIAALMPPHESYVEPFAGGAAVFFHKDEVPVEVLNDKDPEIAFAYRFAKRITDDEIARLRKRQWVVNRATFDRLKRESPKDDLDRFYRFLYLAYARFRKQGLHVNTGMIGRKIGVVDRLPRIRERLQNVRIYSEDFEPVIKKFDSPKTLFYLDPPYPSRIQYGPEFNEQDLERLIKVLSGIKGKFILSLDHEQRKKLPQKWEVKVIRRPRETTRSGDLLVVPDTELLVFNFTPSKENLEALAERPLEDFDAEELILWHNRLHKLYANKGRRKAAGMSLEDVVNEHALVVDEIARRHLRHFMLDELDEKSLPFQTSKFEQYHWPVEGAEGEVTLTEVLESLPQELIIDQPVYLSGRPVNEGRIDPASGSDIDVIFPPLGEELADCLPSEISELLHTFYDADAPSIGFALPIYRITLRKLPLPIPDGEPDETLLTTDIWDLAKGLSGIDDEGLLQRHAQIHKAWDKGQEAQTEIVDVHTLIVLEMSRRHIKHAYKDELDKRTQKIIFEYPPRPEAMKRSLVPAFVKPAPGFEEFEFGDPETLWQNWVEKYAVPQGKKVVVEPKWDGFVMAFVKDGDDVEIITEDEKRDRAKYVPQLVEELKSLPCDQVVFFGEVIWFQDGKATEREQAIRLVVSKEIMADLDVRVFTYEIVRIDGEDLSKLGYLERMKHLDKLLPRDKKHLKKTPRYVVDTKAEFLDAVERVKDLEGSEGAMAKLGDWVFAEATVDKEGIGRTQGMAKFKKTYDIEVEVAKVIPKRESGTRKSIPGQWMYDCVVRDEQGNAIPIGTTYGTSVKANVGDIITVRTQRLRAYTDDRGRIVKLSWMWPKVLGLREKRKESTPWKELLKIISMVGRAEELEPCPFVEDPDVCPLYSRFEHSESLEHLRFPIKCVLASLYRCPLVKPYYYESPQKVNVR